MKAFNVFLLLISGNVKIYRAETGWSAYVSTMTNRGDNEGRGKTVLRSLWALRNKL